MIDDIEHVVSGRFVYVCGKNSSSNSEIGITLKDKLVLDLASRCFVRTHACPMGDIIDNYYAIISSNVFIFTLNSQSILDFECLNQLGIAIAYKIPIIAVRKSDYRLPKALPMRFYETKIIDDRSYSSKSANQRKDTENVRTVSTLASALNSCYDNSIAFRASSYLMFFDQLLQSIADLNVDQNVLSISDNSYSEDESSSSADKNSQLRKSKPIKIIDGRQSSKLSCSPQNNKLPTINDVYCSRLRKLPGKQKSGTSVRKKSSPVVREPLNISSHIELTNKTLHLPASQSWPIQLMKRSNHSKTITKNDRALSGDFLSKNKHQAHIATTTKLQQTNDNTSIHKHSMSSNGESNSVKKIEKSVENGLLLPRSERDRRKLRRVSSLPVVPTQYLVASEKSSESPIIRSYPPPEDPSSLSVRCESPLLFSGDELDYDSVNLSRICTSIETLDNESRADSQDESFR